MFARISTFEGQPERVDEMSREAVEHVLPALRRQDGFGGVLAFAERQSGRVLALSLWESEGAMEASDEASYWFRAFSAAAAGGTVTGVERYEVIISELERP